LPASTAEDATTTEASPGFLVVSRHHWHAEIGQALYIGVFLEVAALYRIAQIMHDLGDTAHADTADTDEMYGAQG
jgi:fucose permease